MRCSSLIFVGFVGKKVGITSFQKGKKERKRAKLVRQNTQDTCDDAGVVL